MNDVKLTLNIRQPPTTSDAVKTAAKRKAASIETMEDAWVRILAMNNSPPDQQRLLAVKVAMQDGEVGRDSPEKRFSKAEALRMWRTLDAKKQADNLRRMVEEMPSNYWLITDKERLAEFMGIIGSETEIVYDVETTGVDIWEDYIVGYVITAIEADIHGYIPTKHDDDEPQLDHEYVNEVLRPLLEDADIGKVAHGAKFDIHMTLREGIDFKGLTWDTLEAMKLLNENEMSYALKPLVTKYLNEPSQTYGELFGQRGFNEIPLDEAVAYAAKDGDVTLRLRDFQREHLAKMPSVLTYFETVEVPLIPLIVEMETEGYEIDLEFAATYGDELRRDAEIYGKRLSEVFGDININSPVQLKATIEGHIGKAIADTDAKRTLKPLSMDWPIIADLLSYREINKLLGTYVDALPEMIRKKTGRLHANFNQNGAKTGRFSSNNPNLQNQPYQARKMFVAPEGYYIVSADFSAQEVRIIASLSGEQVLLDAFERGVDAYATLASEFFNKPYDECYKLPNGDDTEERKRMKVVLLMSMYGASKHGLATALDISVEEAAKFLVDFFKKYKKIDAFIKESEKFANKHGFVWIGDEQRKRRLPDAKGNLKIYDPKRNRAMRQSSNGRVQGLASIQTKETMLALHAEAKKRDWKLWSTTHDEIQVLMPTSSVKEDFDKLDEIMTQTHTFEGVSNETDVEIQLRWSDSITLEEYLRGVEVPKL
ncbi:DNA polymerase I [Sporosarcina sp. E16_3]|uniref:DNA polymerase n=1 Tax=Sporosarcina sp. E16_3 TaxID=2789293 RepID=UPI001A92964B|nr:DNA polymerase [Sporosarcina sp. E16_3]MBO0602735.1 DNA polymerase I [Sporosarcina sp. E16_3]